MRFDARIEGLREFQDRIEKIAETVDTIHDQTPTFEDLFDPAFMLAYTRYGTIGELLEQGFGLSSAEDFMHLADDERDRLARIIHRAREWAARRRQSGSPG